MFRRCLVLGLAVQVDRSAASAQPSRATDHGVGVVTLASERISAIGLLQYPVSIASVNGFLFVVDTEADSMIVVLDGRTGQLVTRFGRRGRGAGQFEAPVAIDQEAGAAGAVWVIDGALRRAVLVSLGLSRAVPGPTAILRSMELNGAGRGPITAAFVDSASTVLGVGFFSSAARFMRFSSGASFALPPHALGEVAAPQGVPAEVRQHAFQSSIVRDPRGGRFAAATRYSDRFEIYTREGGLLAEAPRLRRFDPTYGVRRTAGGMSRLGVGMDLRYGYISLAADGEGVFALYSGRTHLEAGRRAPYGAVVEQLDWHATRVRTYVLDADALSIAVDPSRGYLYAVVHEPAPALLRYRLPSH